MTLSLCDLLPTRLFSDTAQVEAELQQMEKEEAKEWLEMLGITDGGLANLIRATYR